VYIAAQYILCFGRNWFSARLFRGDDKETAVDIALNLNVVAVCAVFVFLSAILLGAF
jgi:hypothetical protein